MSNLILQGDPPIEVVMRASSRARRLSLRVSRLDGRVTLTCPPGVSQREADAFARAKEDWMRKHLDARPAERRPQIGGTVLFEGREVEIHAGPVRSAKFDQGVLWVPDVPDMVGPRLAAFFKLRARARLSAATSAYAAQIGRGFSRIALRDTRSRWGSCSSTGTLSYSWRLIMAPPAVLDYVAAHEVAHLAEMNHSAAFWAEVEALYPGYDAPRLWLRNNGEQLHQIRFEAQTAR